MMIVFGMENLRGTKYHINSPVETTFLATTTTTTTTVVHIEVQKKG